MGIRSVFINLSAKARTVRTVLIGKSHAAAFCAKLSSGTTMHQLAAAILADCLKGSEIYEPAVAVYQRHLSRFFRLDKRENNELAVILLESAQARDDSAYDAAVTKLLLLLNIL